MSPLHLVHVLIVLALLWNDAVMATIRVAKKCTNEWMGTISISCDAGTMLEVQSAVHYPDGIPDETLPAVGARTACGRSPSCMIFFSTFWSTKQNKWMRCYRVNYTCIPVKCPQPKAPPSGSVDVTSTVLGSRIQYSCNEGYRLLGSAVSMCEFKGKYYEWSSEAPLCEVAYNKCPTKSSSQHPMGAHGSLCYEFVLQEKTWFVAQSDCKDRGGAVVSVDSLDFLKSAFITTPPLKLGGDWGYFWTGKKPDCNLLIVNVKNAKKHHSVRQEDCGQKNHYICQYEPKPPEKCVALSVADNMVTSTQNDSIGAVVEFTCVEGYRLVGGVTRECLGTGLWSGENPTCTVVDCGEPGRAEIDNITVVVFNQTTYLSYAKYTCPTGYELVGLDTRMCGAIGMWTGAAPYCEIETTQNPNTDAKIQTQVFETTKKERISPNISTEKIEIPHKEDVALNTSDTPTVSETKDNYISYKSIQRDSGQSESLTSTGSGGLDNGLALPIVLTLILLIAIVIFVIIIIIRRRKQRHKQNYGEKPPQQGNDAYIGLTSDCLDVSACSGSANSEPLVENAV